MKKSVFSKQYIRDKIGKGASYSEIYVSILILVGILILSAVVIHDLYEMIVAITRGDFDIAIENFLSTSLELIIGIEFVKMLAKHTPSSVIEVLMFAIARQLITYHGGMLEALIGVIAICILFGIKKYLINSGTLSETDGIVVNGALSIKELNSTYGIHLNSENANTVAGVIANLAKVGNKRIRTGLEVFADDHKLLVYSMDADLIKQVKIVPKEPFSI
jgi:hypothetical protein